MKPHIKYPIISVSLVLLVEALLIVLFLPALLRETKIDPPAAPRACDDALSRSARDRRRHGPHRLHAARHRPVHHALPLRVKCFLSCGLSAAMPRDCVILMPMQDNFQIP